MEQELISINPTYQLNPDLRVEEMTEDHIPSIMALAETNWGQLKGLYYLTDKSFEEREEKVKSKLLQGSDGWSEDNGINFTIFWKDKIVGMVNINPPCIQYVWQGELMPSQVRAKTTVQSGSWLRREVQGKGIGYQVGDFINSWIFKNLPHVQCIIKCSRIDNEASKRNIQKQGLIAAHNWAYEDDLITYNLLREQWEERNGAEAKRSQV